MTNKLVKEAVSSGHGNAIMIAAFTGLILSDIIPTPGDALYFWDQQRLKRKLNKGEITPKQFWAKNAAGYYLYNSAWWTLIFGLVMVMKGNYNQKAKIAIGLAGAGAVVAAIATNIKKDTKKQLL